MQLLNASQKLCLPIHVCVHSTLCFSIFSRCTYIFLLTDIRPVEIQGKGIVPGGKKETKLVYVPNSMPLCNPGKN
jgi:hypothetical protein